MSLDAIGFVLSIAGCPYLFSTGGLPALTSLAPQWIGGSAGVVVLDGWLGWPTGWSERAKPLDGDLEMGAVTFRLHDADAPSGVAAGYPVLTRLATRDIAHVVSTPLALSATAADLTITVGSGAAVGAIPRYVWCEREALRVTARAGNVLTVTRGALGTKAEAHVSRDPTGLPDVFADLPWITRRKVVLWAVDSGGVATVLWIGYAVRSPRLSAEGARFDLPCDSLWQVLSAAPVGDPDAIFAVYGYGRDGATESSVTNPCLARVDLTRTGVAGAVHATANGLYATLEDLRERLVSQLYAQTGAPAWGVRLAHADVRFEGSSATVTIDASEPLYTSFRLFDLTTSSPGSPRGARFSASLVLNGVTRSKYFVLNGGSSNFLVRSLANAPASWASTTWALDGLTTHRSPCCRAVLSPDLWVVLSWVTTSTPADVGPTVSGVASLVGRKVGVVLPETALLSDCAGLSVCQRVTTDHWYDGLRYGASDLLADAIPDDFDWGSSADVHHATVGLQVSRDWIFDGRTTFGRVVTESCQLSGCSPVTRGGRLAMVPWGWPDARAAVTTTLTALDLIGSPTWLVWDEGLANRIKVESDELVIDATDAGSIHRYGPGRQIAVTLLGRDASLRRIDDPVLFARQVLGRLGLWADPLGVARLTVALSRLPDLELGTLFAITEWVLPDGVGGRGLSGALGVVVAREIALTERGESQVTVEALLFPRRSYGYAPCGRVDALPAADTVHLSATPVQGATGYSGGNDTATFASGDRVQLVLRDSTTLTTEDHTVLAVNAGAATVQLAAPVGGALAALIGAGAIVDLRSAHYATPVTAAQAGYMYVGSLAAGVIDGTADPDRVIAP